ncbi:Lrp/AsnC family transcriptional regulator [uncultured Litoreibacter sp.]|uniref:Lrp/AsnC family transcriptional regulator n=1 Tax=uncultured Litoreibacter sp. TaxID=1392394 RepID=UPI0026263D3D|nr:Lrp/AsnC family transcriptional regulator [uncultured Litoreibacter sp.]
MAQFTDTDGALLSLLKQDSRASVTTLAAKLGVARATVQSRLERLQRNGTIRRFTIELSREAEVDVVKAVMLIELQGSMARSIISALGRIPDIVDLHSTNGAWDLVAQIETTSLPKFDRVLRDVREIKGVLNSETCLLLNQA